MALMVKEEWQKFTSTRTAAATTAIRHFSVQDDGGSNITPLAVYTANGLPEVGDTSGGLVCIRVSPSAEPQRRDTVRVETEWSSVALTLMPNPFDDEDVVTIDTVFEDEEYYLDNTPDEPKRCALTNGKPIHPLPKRKVVGYKIVIRRNVAPNWAASEGIFPTHNGTVSDGSFTAGGYQADEGQGFIYFQLGEKQFRNGIAYCVLTINVEIVQDSHQQTFDSRDKEELAENDDGDMVLMPIHDDFGREVNFPWPLDEEGAKLDDPAGEPAQIELATYRTSDFTAIL